MLFSSEKYDLLPGDESDREHHDESPPRPNSARRSSSKLVFGLCSLLAISVTTNVYLAARSSPSAIVPTSSTVKDETHATEAASRFAGLEYKVDTPIYWSTEYGPGVGEPADRDRHWDALDISPGVLALPESYVQEMGLPRSQRFPWDQSKGVYMLGSFHEMHCLKQIQRAVTYDRRGLNEPIPLGHIEHCLDSILQNLMCHADDTPWYQLPPESAREGYALYQSRTCKSWDELLDWTRNYDACFKYDNVTTPEGLSQQEKELEHYRFCAEGSADEKAMKAYYERKGETGNRQKPAERQM